MPTDRNTAIKESGCIACMLVSRGTRPPDVHHLTSGFRRTGDTIGLCPWHHRGVKDEGFSRQQMMGVLGPSYADGRKLFANFFAIDEILLEIQELILERFTQNAWFDYNVPYEVRQAAIELWRIRKHN